jgi:hypothetical protein
MIRLLVSSLSLALPLLIGASAVHAQDPFAPCRGKVVPINSIPGGGVLYKPSNLHGGRGPSFLVQNVGERTNKKVIEVRNARCEVIATLGLFATDQPYGSRYYSRSGGTGQDADELLRLAQLAGSTNILIEGVDKWIRISNPGERNGSVRKGSDTEE